MLMDKQTEDIIFEGIRSNKQKTFIVQYCTPDSETYDNGTQSYKIVYNSKNDNIAAVEAHRLLSNPKIIDAIDKYRAYIHNITAFRIDWLDNSLRDLYNRVKTEDDKKLELSVLKTIGNRINAFGDETKNTSGKLVQMTPEQEKLANKIMSELISEEKRKQIKKVI